MRGDFQDTETKMTGNIPVMIVFLAEAGGLSEGLTEAGSHMMNYLRDHILLGLLTVAVLVAVFITLIWYRICIRKLKGFNRDLRECSEMIEKQRQQESELRKELEKKQKELETALQTAQAAINEKTALLTDLENASWMARLASFRYELKSRKRSGSSFLYSLWPNDENGEPLRFEDWVHPDDIPVFVRDLEEMQQTRKPGEVATFSFRIGKEPDQRYIRALTSLDLSNPDEPAVAGIL